MTTHRSLANDANEHPSPSIPTQTSPATVPPITGILAPAVSCTVTGHHMTTHRAQGTGLRFPVASQATKNASSSNVYSPVNAASSTASSPVNAAPSSTECTQHPNEADDDFPPIRENQDVPTGLQPGAFKSVACAAAINNPATPSTMCHRISHRTSAGPDLNYLYATEHFDDVESIPILGSSKTKTQKRGFKSDKRALRGTTLYLGGEEASNGKIYCIPGHAERVLVIDTATDEVYPIGPIFNPSNTILQSKYKWLRGIVIGNIIYGLPCHADKVLRIDSSTDEVGVIDIPYESYFDGRGEEGSEAYRERYRGWKYHGGAISPHDGCIYAIPQSASRVLRIDPATETCSFVGPKYEGRCKWYGGVVGNTDGAIYAIPQNSTGVLRIDASGAVNSDGGAPESRVLVTTHGDFPLGQHKWHGAAAAGNGTIVSVPANADNVLCIVPASRSAYPRDASDDNPPEPTLYILEGESDGDIATGRHRTDGKYKYLGAMAGTDGHVYCFPSGSERVLQVDTVNKIARSVGPNLRDKGMESMHQNKWQNGLTTDQEGCVYAIPLAAETVLRIRTGRPSENGSSSNGSNGSANDVEVTTWKLPEPSKTLEKWEGGVLAKNGVMYCMPNNHKAVLQIVPPCVPSRDDLAKKLEQQEIQREKDREARRLQKEEEKKKKLAEKEAKRQERKNKAGTRDSNNDEPMADNKIQLVSDDGICFKYTTGIATLRSSAHRVKYSLEHRKHDPNPVVDGKSTNTTFLPAELIKEDVFAYNTATHDFHKVVVEMLQACDEEVVGKFRTLNGCRDTTTLKLDNFTVPVKSLTRKCQKGKLEMAQVYLSDAVASNSEFLSLFDRFLVDVILPHLKQRLIDAGVANADQPTAFYYQRPPTLRIQPGPARALVKAHDDAEYGHQNGELNFWLPLTNRRKTGVDLWCESTSKAGDFHPLIAEYGQVASFHGSSCRHYVNSNHSLWTRVSLDFRVGVEGYFDPQWQMIGTTDDHSRRKVML